MHFGQRITALNGGPAFKFTEAISLQVNCSNQQEVDDYWDKLSKDGDPKAQRAMDAILRMKKIDIRELERAAAGERVTA